MQWRVCVDDVQAAWSEHGDTKGGQVGGGGGGSYVFRLALCMSLCYILRFASHCFGPL